MSDEIAKAKSIELVQDKYGDWYNNIGIGKIVFDSFCRDKKSDLAFLSIGTRLSDTIKVAKNLKNKGYSVSVAVSYTHLTLPTTCSV